MSEFSFEISPEEFQEFQAVLQQLEATDTDDFLELANLLGRNPKTDLSGADLSGINLRKTEYSSSIHAGIGISAPSSNVKPGFANFRGADLRGANLRGAYLFGANLINADLRGADLRGANLRGAYLIGANLSGANLSDAYLSGASLSRAIVAKCRFGSGIELNEAEKIDLQRRGAIFDDAIGDREAVDSPVPSGR